MNHVGKLLAAALALAMLAGCGPKDAPQTDQSAGSAGSGSISSGQTSGGEDASAVRPEDWDDPLIPWVEEATATPDFLSPQLQHLYLRAASAFQFLALSTDSVDRFPLPDGTVPGKDRPVEYETVVLDDMEYCLSQGRYARWEDFIAMMEEIFTPEYAQELLKGSGTYPPFRPTEDGALAFLSAGRGGNFFYDFAATPDQFRLEEESEEAVSFTLIGHYAEPLDEKGDQTGEVYTQEFPIRFVRTEDGWRVAEFHIPY